MDEVFFQQVVNGLTIGMIYALIALGYTLVYGIARLINFAHGEVFMVGAYLGLLATMILQNVFHLPPGPFWIFFVFIFSIVFTGLLGV